MHVSSTSPSSARTRLEACLRTRPGAPYSKSRMAKGLRAWRYFCKSGKPALGKCRALSIAFCRRSAMRKTPCQLLPNTLPGLLLIGSSMTQCTYIRKHTSSYVSIRQHTFSRRRNSNSNVSIFLFPCPRHVFSSACKIYNDWQLRSACDRSPSFCCSLHDIAFSCCCKWIFCLPLSCRADAVKVGVLQEIHGKTSHFQLARWSWGQRRLGGTAHHTPAVCLTAAFKFEVPHLSDFHLQPTRSMAGRHQRPCHRTRQQDATRAGYFVEATIG
jgi:hypothetical protein